MIPETDLTRKTNTAYTRLENHTTRCKKCHSAELIPRDYCLIGQKLNEIWLKLYTKLTNFKW